MKKFLIFLSIALLLGAGYFTYDTWLKDSDYDIWSFVPDNSILVLESSDPLNVFEEIKSTSIWKNLSYIQEFDRLDKTLNLLDSIGGAGSLKSRFANHPLLISVNTISAGSFGFLFITEIKHLSQQTLITKAQDHWLNQGFKKRTREYEGFTITEISKGTEVFTYIFYKNFFIASSSAFLVEDAIRTISNESSLSFGARFPELTSLTKLEKDQGNIYFNLERLDAFSNLFNKDSENFTLGRSAFLDLKLQDKSINLTGFSYANTDKSLLSCFNGNPGSTLEITEIIPNNAAWFYHISAENPVMLGEKLIAHYKKNIPDVTATISQYINQLDFDANHTYNLINEEMALVYLESSPTDEPHQLFILKMKDIDEALKFYNSAGERQAIISGDSVFMDQFGDYQIRKLPANRFAYCILGNLAPDFGDAYYLAYRNFLVFSNKISQLKRVINSIENEATWKKSVNINRFLDQTNKEAGFSFYMNVPRSLNQILPDLKPEWSDFVNTNQLSVKNMEFLALQCSPVDDKFYTNILIYQPKLNDRIIPENIKTLESVALTDYITCKPYLVTNHQNRQKEILLQDSAGSLYLISNEFDVLWSLPIDEQMIGRPFQIDYYKNGKLQYAFATQSAVHIIDRTGAYLPEFPKQLNSKIQIQDFNVIDYDNTRNYRFAFTTLDGKAILTDKNLKQLDGWNPNKNVENLLNAPFHCRINGKDFIVMINTAGKISILHRNGTHAAGSPIDLKTPLSGKSFIKPSNDLKSSLITVISENGEVSQINFTGKIVSKNQLYKPTAESVFSILADVTGDTYKILRQSDHRIEVLEPNGNALFEKEYMSSQPVLIQYYQLGGGKEFIVVVDQTGQYLYLYDMNGKLLTGSPLSATQPVSIMQYDDKLRIFKAVDKMLEMVSVSY